MRIDQRLQLPLKRHVPQEVRRVENDRNGLEPLENLYDENHDTTDIQTCYVSRQPAMNYKKKMYVCDSTEKTASIDRLRYNREQVSNLFFIHENTTQELNRTDICLTTTQPCIGHMSPVIIPKSAMYYARLV